jgi:cell division protein FtsW (lipid II flippase)
MMVQLGRIIGVPASLIIIAFWVNLLRTVKSGGALFVLLGFGSMMIAALAFAAVLKRWWIVLVLSALLLSPLALYFHWTNGPYRWITIGTLGLATSGVLMAIARPRRDSSK